MYQAVNDVLCVSFTIFATLMAWWLLFDPDSGVEID